MKILNKKNGETTPVQQYELPMNKKVTHILSSRKINYQNKKKLTIIKYNFLSNRGSIYKVLGYSCPKCRGNQFKEINLNGEIKIVCVGLSCLTKIIKLHKKALTACKTKS